MKWITASDLQNWANTQQRNCADTLPELIYRLILASTNRNEIEEIHFPSGDSVAHSGWDGRLNTTGKCPFFPTGKSGWEIGKEASAGTKATKDYNTRTSDSLGLIQSETDYVFVTPRAWPEWGQWQEEKRLAGVWKDVHVITSVDLEHWLDSSPAVALWLCRKIKGLPLGFRDIESLWCEWSATTSPKMTVEITIGGREKDMKKVQEWVLSSSPLLEIQWDRSDEPFSFLYASIAKMADTDRDRSFASCVHVETIEQLRYCAEHFSQPLIILAPSDCRDAVGYAIGKGHRVFLSTDPQSLDLKGNIMKLSRPEPSLIESELNNAGMPELESQKIARDFWRSIPVLHRNLMITSAKNPVWANEKNFSILLPVLFTGAWNETYEGDRSTIEGLSGIPYDDYIEVLKPLLLVDDSPIRKVWNVWMLKSPLDAWFLLAWHLSQKHLRKFEEAVVWVLTKVDPKYDLESEKRWMAAIYDKSNPYSDWIQRGLAGSLILIALYGDRSTDINSTQAFSDNVVKAILTAADKWEAWSSVKNEMPLLAEASPEEFLNAIERVLKTNPAIFKELMSKDTSGIFWECRHCGLIWWLESLVWGPEYFSRGIKALLELSKLDTGTGWNNSASNTLRNIFLPITPQTYTTPHQRLTTFSSIAKKEPSFVWNFSKSYFSSITFSEAYRFIWRDAWGNRKALAAENPEDRTLYLDGLFSQLKELASQKENIISSLGDFTHLHSGTEEQLLNVLQEIDTNTFSKEERESIFELTRDALNWINRYGDPLKKKQVPALYKVYERFTPVDTLGRVGWILSTPFPKFPHWAFDELLSTAQVKIEEEQQKAAREIMNDVKPEKILDFSKKIRYPGILWHSMALAITDENESQRILDLITNTAEDNLLLIIWFVSYISKKMGDGWIPAQIERWKKQGGYTEAKCASLYMGLPWNQNTWSMVAQQGKSVEDFYWKHTMSYRSPDNNDASLAIEKLLDANRPQAALEIAGYTEVLWVPTKLLQRLLQSILLLKSDELDTSMLGFYLGHIFNQLYERNDLSIDDLIGLEWSYIPAFKEISKYTKSPMAVHRALQNNPTLFSQLVSFIYKSDVEAENVSGDSPIDENIQKRAHVASELLDSWTQIPGLQTDWSIDEDKMYEWLVAARDKCSETGHSRGYSIRIWEMLAHTPADSQGVWPSIPVRNIIEKLDDDSIDLHASIGFSNQHSTVIKNVGDGTGYEKSLAEKYKNDAEGMVIEWPRSSWILKNISKSFERSAVREDIENDLRSLQ